MTPLPNQEFDELESMVDGTMEPSEFVGDIMEDNPDQDTTRIYIQNLNGLCWNKEGGRWPYICEVMSTTQIDVACFSELNVDTNRYEIRSTMEKTCQKHFDQNCLVLASSSIRTSTQYKPGGTAILACNNITARIHKHTRDRLGRWASICFQATPTKRVRIISAYQVCQNARPGTLTAASQQIAQLIQERPQGPTSYHNPRQSFIHDLTAFIQQVQNNDEDVILVGDFNDDITDPDSGMHKISTACTLVDLFSTRLGTASLPSTYQRGTRRLDYILISPSLLRCVKAAGYDPFGYRVPSDHRGMFVDLSSTMVFQEGLPSLPSATKREFQTSQPGVIQRYVTAKINYLTDHQFFARLQHLNDLQQPNHALAESLDRDLQRASFHAGKVCSKKPKPPWSPQLAQVWAELHYYRLLISAIKTNTTYQAAAAKLRSQWPNLPESDALSHQELIQRQKQAMGKLKQIRMDAQRMREEFLNQRYTQALEDDDRHAARIIQRIRRAENQTKVYKKFRAIRNNGNGSSGLTYIKVPKNHSSIDANIMKTLPDTDDHWETITVPQQIEQLLIRRNQHHFGQAHGTPFTLPPLSAEVGYKADGCSANLILSGQVQYGNMSNAAQLFIKHLQRRSTQTLDGSISYNDAVQKLKNWHEATTTSPSGLHLGHYHCCWKDPRMNASDPAREIVISNQKRLVHVLVSLLNYSLRFSYSYERWSKIVNIMLEKDAGNPRIHRLRVIHIYEADYNLLLAVKWRQALYHAEDNHLLNDGLYGSRPGRTAHDPALLEVLQNEIYRMSMKPGVSYDLDAASCYDRILASVAVLSSRRIGLSPQVAHVNALTLEGAKYHIKTQAGVSQQSYSHTEEMPVHGTGQGSGNSPMIWCFVCSSLFDALTEVAHGATFHDYSGRLQCSTCITGFVDDCSQRTNLFHLQRPVEATELLGRMKHDAQCWNDLLWSSGGVLEQSKCSYHLIESAWNSNGHPFLKGGTTKPAITISHQGNHIPTQQKSNYEAHKTLGCYINPAFNYTQAWKATKTKNELFATFIDTNTFTRHEAWVFYTSIYLPSITYPLPITPIPRSLCQHLDARFLRSLLPRCGYNRNMSCAIRYAPTRVGGAGFKDMYMEQGALLLQQTTKYFNSPDTTVGKFLYMAASWTQAFLGTSQFFLTDVHSPIPPSNPSWLLDLRIFLQHIQGSIRLKNPPTPTLLREQDRCIMDIVLEQRRWTSTQVTQINSCRRCLQAQTLADIANMQGTRIQQYALQTDRSTTQVPTLRVSSFNQPSPSPKAWATWKRFLRTISNAYGVLARPLGKWTVDVTSMRHWPSHLYDPVTDTFMSHVSGSEYSTHHRLHRQCFSIRPVTPSTPQMGWGFPTAITITMDTIRPECNFVTPSPVPLLRLPITNDHHIQVEEWVHELLRNSTLLCPIEVLRDHLASSNLWSCSDGSVVSQRGGFGFVIATSTGRRLVKGHGEVPGSYHNSFRSEAVGILSTILWLYQAYQETTVTTAINLTHYLDNQSVISRLKKSLSTKRRIPNAWLLPDQDVIEEIWAIIKHLPVKVTFEWVRGHQDATQSYVTLPLEAKLNCEADNEAAIAATHLTHQPTIPQFPHVPCALIIQGKTITGHLKRHTHEANAIPRLQRYLKERYRWSQATFEVIDWPAYEAIIRKYKDRWTTLVKHLHSISPTGKIANRNNPLLPHECPSCMAPYETNHHVIQCPDASRAKWRHATVIRLTRHQEGTIDPYLCDILRDGLSRYHQQLELVQPGAYPPKYTLLISQQNAIGWNQIYQGRWSQEWARLQDQYNPQNGTVPSCGSLWILQVGRIAIDQWYKVWEMRNKARHCRDNERIQEQRGQLLHRELRRLYDMRGDVCPADKNIFHASVEIHIQRHKSLDQLEDWLTTFRPVIMASIDHAKILGITRNSLITDFPAFNPIHPTTEQASLPAGLPGG